MSSIEIMKEFDNLPKSVKKAVRYIYQDASYDQLLILKKHLAHAIQQKEQELYKKRLVFSIKNTSAFIHNLMKLGDYIATAY
ncbi:hypothetical protein F6Y02_17425 [Bacillus megaterium]|nr:hypothetical protein [Priestia megaterium]